MIKLGCLGGVTTPRRDQLTHNELMKSSLPPVGQVFGRLTVLGPGKRKYYWQCQCSCGNLTETSAHRVIHGNTKSCGCIRKEVKRDLTGKRFGRLMVIGHIQEKPRYCLCQCDCGSPVKAIENRTLLSGESNSCGCYRLEQATKANTRHGKTNSRSYKIWLHMIGRCKNPNDPGYVNYGGRGIKVCPEWQTFEAFYADMGDPPTGTSIERIDNNGPYAPWNCKWATPAEQVRNRRNSVWITFNGRTQIMGDWANEIGVSATTLLYRKRAGWSVEKMLTTPGRQKKKEA